MMADVAICYVADLNFLLSALTSLRSLRRFVPASVAEVYVFYLNPDTVVMERVRRSLSRYDARLLPLRIDNQIDVATKAWNRTHVPHSALGRFYIEPYLPAHIQRILYVDGDTLFVRDPTALMRFVPSENGLAAAEDIFYFAATTGVGSASRRAPISWGSASTDREVTSIPACCWRGARRGRP